MSDVLLGTLRGEVAMGIGDQSDLTWDRIAYDGTIGGHDTVDVVMADMQGTIPSYWIVSYVIGFVRARATDIHSPTIYKLRLAVGLDFVEPADGTLPQAPPFGTSSTGPVALAPSGSAWDLPALAALQVGVRIRVFVDEGLIGYFDRADVWAEVWGRRASRSVSDISGPHRTGATLGAGSRTGEP